MLLAAMLCGCTNSVSSMEPVLELRTQLQEKGCSFDTVITADYGDKTYTFAMDVQVDAHGNLSFQVEKPESIAGICGKIDSGKGKITFEDTVLAFSLLADGQLSPVSAPWVVVGALRGGYLLSCGKDGDHTQVTLHDSYENDAMTVEVWLDPKKRPIHGEIIWKEHRILTIEIENFQIP